MSLIFEEMFFSKADSEKFRMFRVLNTLDDQSFTLNDIGTQMNMSYQKTYNIYQGLLDDMGLIDPSIKYEKINKKDITSDSFPVPIDMYRLFLLKESIVFQAFDYAFQTQKPAIDEFCNAHFISKSTLLRKMAPLRKHMKQYGITISTTNLKFEGDERCIHFFLFCIYWIGFHAQEWPIKFIPPETVRPILERAGVDTSDDPILTLQNTLFVTICRVRIINGYTVPDMTDFKSFFYDSEKREKPFLTTDDYPRFSYEDIVNESLYIYFYMTVTGRVEHRTDPETQEFYQYNRTHNTLLWQFSNEFFNFISDYYDVNSEVQERALNTNIQLVGNLMRIVLSYAVLDNRRIRLLDFYHTSQLNYERTTLWDIITLFFKIKNRQGLFQELMPFQKLLTSEIYYLIAPYLKVLRTGQLVKVKVVVERGDLLSRDINFFLEDLNTITILPKNAPLAAADVIITSIDLSLLDVPELPDNVEVIKWNLDAWTVDFYKLYLKIQACFRRKLGGK